VLAIEARIIHAGGVMLLLNVKPEDPSRTRLFYAGRLSQARTVRAGRFPFFVSIASRVCLAARTYVESAQRAAARVLLNYPRLSIAHLVDDRCYSSLMLPVFPLLVLLSMASSAAPALPQKSFDEIAKQADSARNADRTMEAIALYREAVQLRPSWEEGWLWLGNLLYDQDRFPEAQASFARFVAIKPKPGPVWAMKGLCEFEMRDFPHATEDLQTWVHGDFHGSDNLSDVAAFHWAMLLTRESDFGRALYVLADRAQRSGESPPLVEAMGLASLRMANLPEDYPPESRERVWLAGKAAFYVSVHDFARGQEYSHRLLAEYGQVPNVHYLQGTFLKFEMKPVEAAQEFRKELQISPQHAAAMLELARIEIDTGELAEAESLSRHAVGIEPTNPDAHHILGRALLAAGQAKESAQELEAAVRLAPDSAAIHFHLASAYRELGRKEDAEREMSTYSQIKERWLALDRAAKGRDAEHPLEAPE
jgi:tetratricopeptide (TPR) repeat protein